MSAWVFPTKPTKIDQGEIFICIKLYNIFLNDMWVLHASLLLTFRSHVCGIHKSVSLAQKISSPRNGNKGRKMDEWTNNEISTLCQQYLQPRNSFFFFSFFFAPIFFLQLSSSLHYLIKRHEFRTFMPHYFFLMMSIEWIRKELKLYYNCDMLFL